MKTRSYSKFSSICTASRPLATMSTRTPIFSRMYCATFWLKGLSSATSTRRPCNASAGASGSSCARLPSSAACVTSASVARGNGSSRRKLEPLPMVLSASSEPCISSASCRLMARPRPVPP